MSDADQLSYSWWSDPAGYPYNLL